MSPPAPDTAPDFGRREDSSEEEESQRADREARARPEVALSFFEALCRVSQGIFEAPWLELY